MPALGPARRPLVAPRRSHVGHGGPIPPSLVSMGVRCAPPARARPILAPGLSATVTGCVRRAAAGAPRAMTFGLKQELRP